MFASAAKRYRACLAVLCASALATAAMSARAVPPEVALASWRPQRAVSPERHSTLDPLLQAATQRLLADAHPMLGGIIAVHAPTGRVLAWQEYRRPGLSGHPNTQAITPAASLFKIVTSVALFERGQILPSSTVCISGGEHSIERFHLTRPPSGDPRAACRPFEEALGFSRNAVFAQLATERLLRRDLIDVASRLGFNQPLPFDVPAEMGVLDVPYNDLEFARTAAGFRGSRLSVLGAARLALLVANDGRARRITWDAGALVEDESAVDPMALPMQPTTARRLRRMLEFTVQGGTSFQAFRDPEGNSYLGKIRAAGKTGTLRPTASGPTASWFIGFAPSRAPELVVSVMLDNSPVWRRKANHVARDVFRAYFHAEPGVNHPFDDG